MTCNRKKAEKYKKKKQKKKQIKRGRTGDNRRWNKKEHLLFR